MSCCQRHVLAKNSTATGGVEVEAASRVSVWLRPAAVRRCLPCLSVQATAPRCVAAPKCRPHGAPFPSSQPQAVVGPRSALVPPSLRADRRSEAVQLRATGQRASPPCSSRTSPRLSFPRWLGLCPSFVPMRVRQSLSPGVSMRRPSAPVVSLSRFAASSIPRARPSAPSPCALDSRTSVRCCSFCASAARARGQPINGVNAWRHGPTAAARACPRCSPRALHVRCLALLSAPWRSVYVLASRAHAADLSTRSAGTGVRHRDEQGRSRAKPETTRTSGCPQRHRRTAARRVRTVWRGELGATPDTRFYLAATHSLAFRDNDGLTNCESVPADDARKAWVRRARALRDWLRVRPATTRRAGRASTARAYAARRYRTHQSGSGARGRADVAGKEEERHETRVLANTSGRRAGPSRSASPTSRKQYCAVTSQGAGGQGANKGDRKRSTQGYRTRTAEANGWADCEHGLTPRWRSCCDSRLSLKRQNAGCCDSRRVARRGGSGDARDAVKHRSTAVRAGAEAAGERPALGAFGRGRLREHVLEGRDDASFGRRCARTERVD
ncbi:hypothetical protein ERJ75_001156900 [Trypanosoma vivax]|nr:hypothetical protein ERJ75_001156900 [Trypanosoma vivax]